MLHGSDGFPTGATDVLGGVWGGGVVGAEALDVSACEGVVCDDLECGGGSAPCELRRFGFLPVRITLHVGGCRPEGVVSVMCGGEGMW